MKDKELTKRKLINAVGEIFRTEGYTGLGVNKVARIANVDKKLIYRYFNSFERLIEAYVVETDYWMRFANHMRDLEVPQELSDVKQLFIEILQNQFLHFSQDVEMQQLILWELSAKSDLMKSIHQTRELFGRQFLELADPFLSGREQNFRAVAGLLVGGIYYMILHVRYNGGIFSDLDLTSPQSKKEILNAIEKIIDGSFVSDAR